MTQLNIAQTIINQLGNKALYMIGAKKLMTAKDGLSFRIGRNHKGINHVNIKLNNMDLYDVTYGSIRGVNYKIKSKDENIYCDMLNKSIEENTGLYTSL